MMDADTETVFCDPEVVDRVHPELYAHRTRDGRWHISVKQHSGERETLNCVPHRSELCS